MRQREQLKLCAVDADLWLNWALLVFNSPTSFSTRVATCTFHILGWCDLMRRKITASFIPASNNRIVADLTATDKRHERLRKCLKPCQKETSACLVIWFLWVSQDSSEFKLLVFTGGGVGIVSWVVRALVTFWKSKIGVVSSHKRDEIGVGRIRAFPFSSYSVVYDLVKTRLSESEAEVEEWTNHYARSHALWLV